ncbi:MAG: histone deacetylase [Halochromatium sp.]|nr:histone deacetylase [Halochromatium sp.]
MTDVGILVDNRFLDHKIDVPVKECPERLRNLYPLLKQRPCYEQIKVFSATPLDEDEIAAVHSRIYLDQVREHAVKENPFSYDKDTYLTADTPYVAQLVAGGCRRLADAIMDQEVRRGFALVRPPGHHAEIGRGMGFCIYNNIALTAKHLLERHGLNRILILDYDVHHGNGTQDIFYQTSQVLTLSIHERDLFPFTGQARETGDDAGVGHNINVPIPSHFGDKEYSYILGNLVQDVIENYLPQIILVSAGFDAHKDDTISHTEISTQGFAFFIQALRAFAESCCDGRLMLILEGGYNINALADSVLATMDALTAPQNKPPGFIYAPRAQKVMETELPSDLRRRWNLGF